MKEPEIERTFGDKSGYTRYIESIDITLHEDGEKCDVKVNGEALPFRHSYAFDVHTFVEEKTYVTIHSYVSDPKFCSHQDPHFANCLHYVSSGDTVFKVSESFYTPKLTINGQVIWERSPAEDLTANPLLKETQA